MLRAIGVSRRRLRWMITLESVVISGLGAALVHALVIGVPAAVRPARRAARLDVLQAIAAG